MSHLGVASKRQYVAAWQWFTKSRPNVQHRSEVQEFIDTDTKCSKTKKKYLQVVCNKYVNLDGPPITLGGHTNRTHVAGASTKKLNMFVPRYVLHSPLFSQWKHILEQFIVCLGPLKTNSINIRYTVSVVWKCVALPLNGYSPDTSNAQKEKLIIDAILCHSSVTNQPFKPLLSHVNKFVECIGLSKLSSRVIAQTIGFAPAIRPLPRAHRGTFNSEEVRKLLQTGNIRDRCVLTLLAQTGLRRRAVSWIPLANVWCKQTGTRNQGSVVEKGGKLRTFPIGVALQSLINDYVRHHRVTSFWLFPSCKNPANHIVPSTIEQIVKRACAREHIHGPHVHTHAFRRYVVQRLIEAGNSIDHVSKWIGHRNPKTTYEYYWHIQLRDLMDQMTVPWL